MGCASSKPEDLPSPRKGTSSPQGATNATANSSLGVSPQPLYAGQQQIPQKIQQTPAITTLSPAPPGNASVASSEPASKTALSAHSGAFQASADSAATAQPGSPALKLTQYQSALNSPAAATGSRKEHCQNHASIQHQPSLPSSHHRQREADEDSDWDQCSTCVQDIDAEDTRQEVAPTSASVVEKAQHSSLYAEQSQQAKLEAESVKYKETTTLRIDKVKGCMFVNQYLVVKFLGRGACGKVFLCLSTLDLRLYAMKAVRKVDLEAGAAAAPGKKRNPMEDLKREIMIMKKMKHTNIVTLSEVIDDPAGSKLLLVMEFMEGGPVLTREALEKRERLPESMALQYFRDMVKALDYLHGHKVVHGDLKPENVLMAATGDVKLSDFGCSKVFATGNEYLERCNGTPAFLAPEMMKPNTRYRGRPTDVYALGACLYTLVFGRIPFSAPNLYKLFQVVQNEPVRYPEDVPISDALRNLLDAMLTKNPRERITLAEIMRHPWVTVNGHFVLKAHRELKAGESQEVHAGVPGGQSFAAAHPLPDFLAAMATLSRHERTFNDGDVIMRQGDMGTFLVYIVSGTVDVLVRWSQPAPRKASSSTTNPESQHNGAAGAPPGAAAGGGHPHHHSGGGRGGGDEFMDESDAMSPITDESGYAHRVNLMRSANKARDFVKSLQSAAGGSRDLLVAQRGAGELVGEMSLFTKSMQRCATVRCSGRVTARIITHEQLVEFLLQQPMAKNQIREGIWKKESEITMVEALVKLANVNDIIAASLENVQLPLPTTASAPPPASGNSSKLPLPARVPSVSMPTSPASAGVPSPSGAAAAAAMQLQQQQAALLAQQQAAQLQYVQQMQYLQQQQQQAAQIMAAQGQMYMQQQPRMHPQGAMQQGLPYAQHAQLVQQQVGYHQPQQQQYHPQQQQQQYPQQR